MTVDKELHMSLPSLKNENDQSGNKTVSKDYTQFQNLDISLRVPP